MPTLRELDAHLLKRVTGAEREHWRHVDRLADADGILFVCPRCYAKNGNSTVGVHSVLCWFHQRVPADVAPPGRWKPDGGGLDDLSFIGPEAHSVELTNDRGCQWHGFVTNGSAE